MNNKSSYIKIVYHHIHGDLYKTFHTDRSFHIDFPRVHMLFTIDHCVNVTIFDTAGNPITIWKDKHGNIIARLLYDKQTKINF